MDFHFSPRQPTAPLSALVTRLFCARGRIPYKFDKILPNGAVVVIINLGEPHRVGKDPRVDHNPGYRLGWIHGVQTSPLYNYPLASTHVMGCVFDPLGLSRVLGRSLRPWADRTFALEEVAGLEALAQLRSRLLTGGGEDEKFARLQQTLQGLFVGAGAQPEWLERGYRKIVAANGLISLEALYRELPVSGRYFSKLFLQHIGVSPKRYCRVLRLNHLLGELDSGRPLTDIACAHEFTDQPHFNREFKHYAGMSPSAYFAERRRVYGDLAGSENGIFIPGGA